MSNRATTVLYLRLDPDLHRKLKQAAEDRGMSLASLTRHLLAEAVAALLPQPRPVRLTKWENDL